MPKVEKTKKKTSITAHIHPKSRKAGQLSKAIHHEERKQKRKDEYDSKQVTLREKVLWFQEQLNKDQDRYSLIEVAEIIKKYINRFDNRLQEIKEQNEFNKQKGRHGRYHAAEEQGIIMVREREFDLFKTGKFEAPDLTNVSNVKILKNFLVEDYNNNNKQLHLKPDAVPSIFNFPELSIHKHLENVLKTKL